MVVSRIVVLILQLNFLSFCGLSEYERKMNQYLSVKFKVLSMISMILVVILHSKNIPNLYSENEEVVKGFNTFLQDFFSEGISRIAVPFFFSISGYLYFLQYDGTIKAYFDKLKKRFKTVFIPYLIWSVWGFVLFYVLESIPSLDQFFNNDSTKNIGIAQLFNTIILNPLPYQLWFLRDLLVLVLISPILYFVINKLKIYSVILMAMPWFLNIYFGIINVDSLLFFVLGGALAMTDRLQSFKISPYSWPLTFLWLFLAFIHTYLLQTGNANKDFIILVNRLFIFSGMLAIWGLYDAYFNNIKADNLPQYFSFSFFLYAFHEPTLTILKKGLFYLLGKSDTSSLLIYVIAPIFTIFLSLVVGMLLKQVFPKFYAIISGGR